MRGLVWNAGTLVWLVLMGLTLLSWSVGEARPVQGGFGPWASAGVVVLAFFKVRLIGLHFMELKDAPLALRGIFELWAGATCAAVLFVFYLAPVAG